MRILHTILQDIRFQFRYGFYFIYVVMTIMYIVIIGLLPDTWKTNATAIILFTDPAALGFFFVGGILLLEKGERVLDTLFISPIEIWEYTLAKAASLGLISVLAGLIIAVASLGIGVNETGVNIPILIISLLLGSAFYTFIGIAIGVKSKSVNNYIIITVPAEMFLSAPPIILLLGVKSLLLEVMPGSLVLRLFQWCTKSTDTADPLFLLIGLALWCIPAFYFAVKRMNWFLSRIGGESFETDNKAS